jgi:hypothetical protein
LNLKCFQTEDSFTVTTFTLGFRLFFNLLQINSECLEITQPNKCVEGSKNVTLPAKEEGREEMICEIDSESCIYSRVKYSRVKTSALPHMISVCGRTLVFTREYT